MPDKPKFNPEALRRVLNGGEPAALTRKGRVALLVEVANALLSGREPTREAALFVGTALDQWLKRGGNLEKEYLQVVKAHSHHTPSWIYNQHFSAPCPHLGEGHMDSNSSE